MSESNSENEDDSKTSIKPRIVSNIKAASVPTVQGNPSGAALKEQASAPSYFHSLKENEAPPFKRPGKEAKPRLLIGTLITEDDVVEIVAAMDTLNGSNIEFKRKLGCCHKLIFKLFSAAFREIIGPILMWFLCFVVFYSNFSVGKLVRRAGQFEIIFKLYTFHNLSILCELYTHKWLHSPVLFPFMRLNKKSFLCHLSLK